jgi:hypothetical protein
MTEKRETPARADLGVQQHSDTRDDRPRRPIPGHIQKTDKHETPARTDAVASHSDAPGDRLRTAAATDVRNVPVRADGAEPRRQRMSSQVLVRFGIAALGVLALIAGGVDSFVLGSDAAAVAVLAAGTALLIVAVVLPRLTELDIRNGGVSLKLTQEAAASGAPTAAAVMENSGLSRFAITYELVHAELRGDPELDRARVHLQNVMVERAQAMALGSKIPAAEVRALFLEGSPVLRILGIGFMKGDPSTADLGLLVSAVAAPASSNEQLQILAVIEQLWSRWSRDERQYIQNCIRSTDFPPGTGRSARAAGILDLPVEPRPPRT